MPKKILAVDDERHIVRLVEVNLGRAGYEVIAAYSGREALEKARAEKPDLIVLDTEMPDMDGSEVLQALKADPQTQDIPVIMLSAQSQNLDVFRGWQAGGGLHLDAPFDRREPLKDRFFLFLLLALLLLALVWLLFHV